MAATKQHGPRYADAAHEELSLDEVNDRYSLEWILLKVTGFDEHHDINRGYVLAHTKSRKFINKVIKRVDQEAPGTHLYIFFGGSRKLSREECMRRLDELADKPYFNAHW